MNCYALQWFDNVFPVNFCQLISCHIFFAFSMSALCLQASYYLDLPDDICCQIARQLKSAKISYAYLFKTNSWKSLVQLFVTRKHWIMHTFMPYTCMYVYMIRQCWRQGAPSQVKVRVQYKYFCVYLFAFSMSALNLHSSDYYSHLPDNIPTPEQAASARPAPDRVDQTLLVDHQHFGKSSATSLRAEEGVPSLVPAYRELGNVASARQLMWNRTSVTVTITTSYFLTCPRWRSINTWVKENF